MDLNKFTEKSQEALSNAQDLAIRLTHQAVDAEHLLLALCVQEGGLLPRLLRKLDISQEAVVGAVQAALQKIPQVSGPGFDPGKIVITPRLSQVLVNSQDEAKRLKDDYVSVEHLFLALLEDGKKTALGEIFKTFSLNRSRFLSALQDIRGNQTCTKLQSRSQL